MAEIHMHTSDARKGRLQKRFGHDALSEPLYTPMLHKRIQHLLPTIYSGRIGQGQSKVGGNVVENNTAGGLTFALMEQHDLSVDRGAWLRERDEDAMTVTTAMGLDRRTPGGGPQSVAGGDDYFEAKRTEYLRHGNNNFSTASAQYDAGTPDELERIPTFGGDDARFNGAVGPNESTENLIASYPPQYSSPRGRGSPQFGHKPNMSASSFGSGRGDGFDIGAHEMQQLGGVRSASRASNQQHQGSYAPVSSPPQHHYSPSQGSDRWRPQHHPDSSVQSQGSFAGSPPSMSRPGSRNQQHAAYPPTSLPPGAGSYGSAATAYDRNMSRSPSEQDRTPTQALFGLAAPNYQPLDPDGSSENLPGALDSRRR
jgi:hypothetical protein